MVLSRGYLGRMRLLSFLTVPILVLKVLLRCALYSQRWPSSRPMKSKPASIKDMETTFRHVREMTKNAEHEMHAIVLACKRARKQMLASSPATKPTMH